MVIHGQKSQIAYGVAKEDFSLEKDRFCCCGLVWFGSEAPRSVYNSQDTCHH